MSKQFALIGALVLFAAGPAAAQPNPDGLEISLLVPFSSLPINGDSLTFFSDPIGGGLAYYFSEGGLFSGVGLYGQPALEIGGGGVELSSFSAILATELFNNVMLGIRWKLLNELQEFEAPDRNNISIVFSLEGIQMAKAAFGD